MRKPFVLIVICTLVLSLAGCAGAMPAQYSKGSVLPDKIQSGDKSVTLSKISDKLWVHTTYGKYEGADTPSNGMVALTSKGAVLIDTPWTREQTKELLSLIKKSFGKDCVLAIITHAHTDRIGGIDVLLDNNIKAISTSLTAEMAQKQGYKAPKPEIPMDKSILLDYGDVTVEAGYFGEGHTCDNIIVWFPEEKVLFGGCLVKSKEAGSIGNISEANIGEWPGTLEAVKNKYGAAKVVVPGHGAWGDMALIGHTLELLKGVHK